MSKAAEDWKSMKFGRAITDDELHKRTHPAWPYIYFNPGQPVAPEKVNEILEGGIDVHIHGAPLGGWLPGRPTMLQTCIDASEAGMKALVFKDHNTMVNNCAIIIQDVLERMARDKAAQGVGFKPIQVFGGVTLNYSVGGMNTAAVRTALDYGRCKEVWLPSLDAAHQREAMGREGGIRVTDSKGTLSQEMMDVLELLAEYNDNTRGERVVLSACHVSNEEKFDIVDYVNKKGMDVKVLMDHVTQEMTILTPLEAQEMIDKGAYLEFAECSCVPWPGMQDWVVAFDYSFNLIKNLIKKNGPEHLVLISDAGQPGNEAVPGWKNFIKTLLAQGVSESDINVMFKQVPEMLLGKI
ncbi:DUF6282 family protein [Enterocloster aldenensis]|uniref:DUF6282 family protein n=1 Tax=Enterocloster aldenensis TaxID=358742 RepID=UPI004027056A